MRSAIVIFTGILLLSGQAFGADDAVLRSQKDKVSYTIGLSSGKNLRRQFIDIDTEMMLRGLRDSLSGANTLLTDEEMQGVMEAFKKEQEARQPEIRKAMAERNRKEGEAFLAQNRQKEGVTTLSSGVQYRIIREGEGKHPKEGDVAVVQYRGTRLDGSEFDSTYRRNTPAMFRVESGYKGWMEVLPLMREGAKWQVFVPSDLAFGEQGSGPVEPNAALIYDVDLTTIYLALETPVQQKKTDAKSAGSAGKSSRKNAPKSLNPATGK